MFKHFIFLFLIFTSFQGHCMVEDERKEAPPHLKTLENFSLKPIKNLPLPTIEEIEAYTKECGNIPKMIVSFYQEFGNCEVQDKDGFEIYTIQGGSESELALNTKDVRKYLPSSLPKESYHAFAGDQNEGGWWIYNTASTPLTLEFFTSGTHKFPGKSYNSWQELLKI